MGAPPWLFSHRHPFDAESILNYGRVLEVHGR